jgi:hypothetical protein
VNQVLSEAEEERYTRASTSCWRRAEVDHRKRSEVVREALDSCLRGA